MQRGLGSSGSHWLAGMLAELAGFVDVGEVYFSAAFRKDEYRQYQAPQADDMEYILQMCRRNRADHGRYRGIGGGADHEVAYEQLRADATQALAAIATSAGRTPDDEELEQAVQRHDADAIRAGAVEQGNLDLGGRSRGWREDADRELRALLHAELAETIVSLGYPLVECVPESDGLGEPVRFDVWDGDAPVVCATGSAAVTDGVVAELLAGPVVLDLARTGVTDDVVEGLGHCSSLQAVGLHGTSITAGARQALQEARPDLPSAVEDPSRCTVPAASGRRSGGGDRGRVGVGTVHRVRCAPVGDDVPAESHRQRSTSSPDQRDSHLHVDAPQPA